MKKEKKEVVIPACILAQWQFLNKKQVADLLQITDAELNKLRKAGMLTYYCLPRTRTYLYNKIKIDAMHAKMMAGKKCCCLKMALSPNNSATYQGRVQKLIL